MSANPPANWIVSSGTWGTDMDLASDQRVTGNISLKFLNTTPAADPVMISAEYMAVEEGLYYDLRGYIRADSITAGNTCQLAVEWYGATLNLLSTDNAHNAILDAANTWEAKSGFFDAPANARFARVRVSKNNSAFNAWFDAIRFRHAVPGWEVYRNTSQTSVNSLDTIEFDTATTERGCTLNTSTGVVTVNEGGIYSITAGVTMNSLSDTGSAYLILQKNGSGTEANGQFYTNGSGAAANPTLAVSAPVELGDDDTVEVLLVHDEGGGETVDGASYLTYFRGWRVE